MLLPRGRRHIDAEFSMPNFCVTATGMSQVFVFLPRAGRHIYAEFLYYCREVIEFLMPSFYVTAVGSLAY